MENPQQALPKRAHMKPYEECMQIISYCKYSGPKPEDFEPSPPSKQALGDWFPYKKHTAIWNFSCADWTPRPRCRKDCGFCDENGIHISWARNGQDAKQIKQCKAEKYPYVLTSRELHRVPSALCRAILESSLSGNSR